jgi:alpha-1,2-mannosyltransferase
VKSVPARALLGAGAGAFVLAIALYVVYGVIHPTSWTLDPVDLAVYRSGGLIVRQVRPDFNPHVYAPLYQWTGYGNLGLKFTYTPFAAIVFALVSFIPWGVLPRLSMAVNVAALVAALWFTFRGLGYSGRARAAATLLASAAVFWTEPVIRTLYLGQINLALMALIIWDLTQPDTARSRWRKGFGVGIAAGIKLVPLVFIPYLLLARKFRQAAMATAGFAFTVLAGLVIQRHDSVKWWFDGLFFQGGRTGFTGWAGNQSLRGLIARLAGSINGSTKEWAAAAVVVGVIGIVSAAVLDRRGHQMAGMAAAALTGLLLSPISWDHHWVWIAPGAAVAGHYAVRAWRSSRLRAAAWGALAVAIIALYGAWPGSLWSEPTDLGTFSLGIVWQPPQTNPLIYYQYGDQPWYAEYHWHGLQLLTGNAYVLGGLALLVLLAVAALRVSRRPVPVAGPGAALPSAARQPALCSRGSTGCQEQGRSHARYTAVPCRSRGKPAAPAPPAASAGRLRGQPPVRHGPEGRGG